MSLAAQFKARLAEPRIVMAPGVYDAFSSLIAEQAGHEALYLSGASIAYTHLGRPDIGLVGMTEVADVIALIRDRVGLPLVVDADTGYGNALNVQRTMRVFERAGATAIQLEDQVMPKRCGHLKGKGVISADEMVGKVKAAVDARGQGTLVVARTDAIAVEGFEAAMERAHRYAEAGADVLFVEAPQSLDQMRRITAELGPKVPLLANMVEGGDTPLKRAADLEAQGYRLVIFPGALARVVAFAAKELYETIRREGATAPLKERMYDLMGLNGVIGLSETLADGAKYDPGIKGS
ncbi:MAG TPA: oxaloacetate decarboxylase [Azospirillaceae bacterium]|nr:oxaloacetate decarboxylase [Azospirillaceae bacterium]